MKVAVCQAEVVARRPDINTPKIISFMRTAKELRADVAVFSEAVIPGYMVGDEWENKAFLKECDACRVDVLAAARSIGINVVIGTVRSAGGVTAENGREALYNVASVISPEAGEKYIHRKTNLANYREFDDKRHFVSGKRPQQPCEIAGGLISASICEDGWNDDYSRSPIDEARRYPQQYSTVVTPPHLHVNLSCSPFTKGKNSARNKRFGSHSMGFTALVYVNNVGIQNNGKNVFVFDGSSTVYANGVVVGALPALQEGIGIFTVANDGVTLEDTGTLQWQPCQTDPSVGDTLVYAIHKFCEQSGISRVAIALSGGIDSAVSAMLHVLALGPDSVFSVNMPTRYNSQTTRGAAALLASRLGIKHAELPISGVVSELCGLVDQYGVPETELNSENTQARMRGMGVLASLAGRAGAVFPSNGNKAETTVGYCTIGGDHSGYLAPIADLWKEEVYDLARELDGMFASPVLPSEILSIVPSAELSDAHNVDQGHGDPLTYWYHDKLFRSWIEPWCRNDIEDSLDSYKHGTTLEELDIAEDRRDDFERLFPDAASFISDLERWWKLFKGMGAVKRVQSPPIVVVSRRAFGYDFRENLAGAMFTRRYLELKQQLLQPEDPSEA